MDSIRPERNPGVQRVYLSARFGRRVELRRYRDELIALGHLVTSDWIDAEDDAVTLWPLASNGVIAAIADSTVLLAFTEEPAFPLDALHLINTCAVGASRGGRHAEMGAALALQIASGGLDLAWTPTIVLIGPREHILHHHPCVQQVETWAEALAWMGAQR